MGCVYSMKQHSFLKKKHFTVKNEYSSSLIICNGKRYFEHRRAHWASFTCCIKRGKLFESLDPICKKIDNKQT